MRILILADIASAHMKKNIYLLFQANEPNPGVTFSQKILYFRFLPKLKLILKRFKPDILHAHYASSYGLIGALSNYRPFIVSVWGSDIYSFPKEGLLKRKILQFVLKKSDVICSTSYAMAG